MERVAVQQVYRTTITHANFATYEALSGPSFVIRCLILLVAWLTNIRGCLEFESPSGVNDKLIQHAIAIRASEAVWMKSIVFLTIDNIPFDWFVALQTLRPSLSFRLLFICATSAKILFIYFEELLQWIFATCAYETLWVELICANCAGRTSDRLATSGTDRLRYTSLADSLTILLRERSFQLFATLSAFETCRMELCTISLQDWACDVLPTFSTLRHL
jgi:hypothetical protein